MDITVPGGNASEEVTRESLIAISYLESETGPSSKQSSEKLNSENLNLVNGAVDHNLVEGEESDGDEKYRSELISISFLESPEIGSVAVGELKGRQKTYLIMLLRRLNHRQIEKHIFSLWKASGSVWKAMEASWVVAVAVSVAGAAALLRWLLKSLNEWFYEAKLGPRRLALPPGDLGWPFIGNMLPFFKAFKSSNPESFIGSYVSRFGKAGIYKAHLFGNPSVIVTTPETCRKVLTDDDAFQPGWPRAAVELIGKKSFIEMPVEEHKRLRRLTSAPVNGFEALSNYIPYIEENVLASLEKWSKMGEIEFLTQLRKLTFTIIMYIFLSSESEPVMEALEKEYTRLNYGVRAMRINLPGFAYHKALKARKNLVATLQSIVTDRRNRRLNNLSAKRKDMMDALIDVEDENGRKLTDEEIIDILVMYLNAGHESSGHTMMWTTILLNQHPDFLKKAKAEQEEIVRRRPAGQKGLTLREVREMEYLSKVIDETLRYVSFSLVVFRETRMDVNLNGYLIPKGWKVLAWFRGVHYDPEVYPDPKKFDPSRWDGFVPKAGEFLPFGAGSRLCPGNDLAKLEIGIFIHYFLLNYQLEWLDPDGQILYLPHSRPKDNCLARIRKNPSSVA